MTLQVQATLETALADLQLLRHPFYLRWEAGELRREELTDYVEQYRYFEAMLPVFLESLSEQLPDGSVKDLVLANLFDEVSPPSHIDLLEQFARFLDARESAISPAMLQLVSTYSGLLQRGPAPSLAGLWAYESQGAAIADSKADGMVKHYDASSEAIEFWTVHGTIEEDHAKWTLEALETLNPDVDEVRAAALEIANAWWSFLDERQSLAA
jgi:pyrroloquinoline quinone (PQQ) biosynthesis protein C